MVVAQLLSEQCSTCVFRPGDPMHLGPGRLRDLVRSNLDAGAVLICHQTLSYGDHPEVGEAMCRGFFDAYGPQANIVRVMERLSAITGQPWYEEVPTPPAH